MLQKNLTAHDESDPPLHELDKNDLEDCAKMLEYEIFSSNKVLCLYRRNLVKLVKQTYEVI